MRVVQSPSEQTAKFPFIPVMTAGVLAVAAVVYLSVGGSPVPEGNATAVKRAQPKIQQAVHLPKAASQKVGGGSKPQAPSIVPSTAPKLGVESIPTIGEGEALKLGALLEKSFSSAVPYPLLSPVAPTSLVGQEPKEAHTGEKPPVVTHPGKAIAPAPAAQRKYPVRREVAPLAERKVHSEALTRSVAPVANQLKTVVVPVEIPATRPTWGTTAKNLPPLPSVGASHGGALASSPQAPKVSAAPVLSGDKPTKATPVPLSAGESSAAASKNPMVLDKKYEKPPGFEPSVVAIAGDKAWVKISPERVIIVQKGQGVPGLGKFNGSTFSNN